MAIFSSREAVLGGPIIPAAAASVKRLNESFGNPYESCRIEL
jgi:hypothetical protein